MNPIDRPYLVQHFLEHSANRLPDKVALICGDEQLTYKEINERANRLAGALVEMGVERQDRVAIFLDSSVESVISLFGVLKAGAIFIMLSPTLKPKKLIYILNDSGSKILISHKNKASVVNKASSDAPKLAHVIWTGIYDTSNTPRTITKMDKSFQHRCWETALSRPCAVPTQFNSSMKTAKRIQPGSRVPLANHCIDLDLSTIIYTSGSTGDPKGVMSAHYNVVSAATSITTYLENTEDDIILNALPLSFDYGLYQVLMAFLIGGTVILEKSFIFPYKVLERLVQEKATGFPIVPTMAALLLQLENLNKYDFSCLRYITNTAAALPVSHILKLQKLFPDSRIYSMYGLTECKRVSYLPPEELNNRPESVGIPMPNEEVFIVDKEGIELGHDEVGELVVRGSNVMQGYWNLPLETKLRFKGGDNPREKLLFTGDLFRRDKDEFLYFVGRTNDIIKTKGERVSPKEIENCICELEGVSAAAVIGVPDEIFGQAIKAFIIIKKNYKIDETLVSRHCQKNLETFMVPKYVQFCEELPKTSSGKVDKKRLN